MNNISNDLQKLSIRALGLHDGGQEAYDWRRELSKRQTLVFAWETELVNPKYLPEWAILKYAKTESEIPWNSRRWSEFRKREWKRKTGCQILIDGQIFYSHTNTSPELAKVPTKKATRQLYTMILKTIPSTIYEWCEAYEKLLPHFMDDGEFILNREYGLSFWPGVLQFTIAKHLSHSTLHKNDTSTIMDIKSPLPEIEDIEDQFDKGRNRSTLKYSHQSGYSPISLIEAWDKYQREFNRRVQETEDEIAAENSRLDEEFQNAQQEESAS